MSEEPVPAPQEEVEIREGDILFECPHCGKSMVVEAAGAGLMVPCTDCGKQVQVPIPDAQEAEIPAATVPRPEPAGEDPQEVIRQLDAALAMANEQIDRLISEKESLQERRAYLEQIRQTTTARLEHVAEDLSAMQEALDRALEMLAEARAEKPG